MSYLEAVEGLDELPRRIFLEGEREPITDRDGFILPIGTVLHPKDLLEQAVVLAVAPPWTGKTTVAEGISKALKTHPCSELTCFEKRERGAPIEPSWWERWKASEEEAFWIVDGLDEDARKDRQSFKILRLFQDLSEGARARLHLITLCRTNEIPDWFEKGLEELCGTWSPDHPLGLRRLRLAGLDRDTARDHVGPGRFDRVCQLIRGNDLQALASFPAVLTYLARREDGESLTKADVWEGVLKDLLREKRDDSARPSLKEVEARMRVCRKLAAVATFCGVESVQPDEGLEMVFPETVHGSDELRLAAREAWRMSIFERSDRGYRFSQDHVRQWLTAFALRDLTLSQLRPLLSREDGELEPAHEGVVGLLAQISQHEEVRDWLVTAHGGLPGDAAWSLPDAARALDRLQDIARSSPWGLSLWREERLRSFGNVPGIGAEIARRLEEDLHPAEQQLLLEMACAFDAFEAVQPATRLLLRDGHDGHVRARAAELVAQLGSEEHLRPLAQWAGSLGENRARNVGVLVTLAPALYARRLWSFEEAARVALSRKGLQGDWLQHRLAEELDLERSRWLVSSYVVPQPELVEQHLADRALCEILAQATLSEGDLEIVLPVAMADLEKVLSVARSLLFFFLERNPQARRRWFTEGLRLDPERQGASAWRWAASLQGEDAEWLLGLVRQRKGEPAWLWETLFYVSSRTGCSKPARRSLRNEIRSFQPGLIERLMREDKEWAQKRRSHQRTRRKKRHRLEPLVRTHLKDSTLAPRQRMVLLSELCFMQSPDPISLEGCWEDLPAELREEVLRVCRYALDVCDPEPVPDESSSSRETLPETACFDHLVTEDRAFTLTSAAIRKWLPARLTSSVGCEPVLRKCFEVDRNLSEDLFLEAVRQSGRSETEEIDVVRELPPEFWSEQLSARLEEVIQDGQVGLVARRDLLMHLSQIFPARALAVALFWAEGASLALKLAGIDTLLLVAPEEGWKHLRELMDMVRQEPVELLHHMSFHQHPQSGPAADFDSWPTEQIEELAELLLRGLHREADPSSWELGVDASLRSLRDELPWLLYRRGRPGDRAALERLADAHPRLRESLLDAEVHDGAEALLGRLGREGRPPGTERRVPLADMLKLLQEAHYRVLGSADDLLEVLLEQLRVFEIEAKRHLSLLYHPKPPKGQKRKRLHEDALQAYLACRLSDRLPGILAGQGVKVVFVDRETLAARDTRNDLKIQASSYEGKPLTVIIEIKWSDHPDVSTSLATQLGEDYLQQSGYTHGIYLVGWCRATRRWPDPETCEAELAEQADLFGQDHPGLRIVPLVMDLTWAAAAPPPAT